VTPSPPTASSAPTVRGEALVGAVLRANDGVWTGGDSISDSYRWQRCDQREPRCAAIPSATGPTYTVGSADRGSTLDVVITAANQAGRTSALSVTTAVVTAPPPLATFGNPSPATASAVPGAGLKRGSIFTTDRAGITRVFRFYVAGGHLAESLVPVSYTVVDDHPGRLLGRGPSITVAGHQAPGGVSGPLVGVHLAAHTR